MGEALSLPDGAEGQAQDLAGSAPDSVLLSQLITLLHHRQGHSLLLSDLGALLPGILRQRVKDQGGLRSWLQRYPSLFAVVGQPGKESVVLCLGAAMQHLQGDVALPAPVEPVQTGQSDYEAPMTAIDTDFGPDGDRAEEDIDTLSAVQLRGLPYRATMEDVVTFLGEYSSDLAESTAVQLVQNRDGRPSGFARVQFTSPESARKCVASLHLRSMDDRYVEVFLYSERPSKGRQRRGGHEDGTAAPGDPIRFAPVVDASGVTKDQVVRECRTHMADVKSRRLLLSMLGVGLSPESRSYLKQMDQGLKHFLSQFPNEFSVDGGKGCEYVTYTPTQLSLSQAIDGFDASSSADSSSSAVGRAIGSRASGADDRPLNASPKPMAAHMAASPGASAGGPASATRGISTPSDWGTPAIPQWPGAPAPWVPPWPQGVPGGPGGDAAAWDAMSSAMPWGAMPGAMAATPWGAMPGAMQGWPSYPPWGANPPSMEGMPPGSGADAAAVAAAAAALGAAPLGFPSSAPAAAPQQSANAPQASAPDHAAGPPVAAVRLRGLPFTSQEQDVLAFFAQHDIVDRIADGPNVVNILTRSNGRPSGQAIIQMRDPKDAELAQLVLHGQWMGSRYIEVFLVTSEENEAQQPGGAAPATLPSKGGEKISLSQGVPAPRQMQAPTQAPSAMSQPPAGLAGPTDPSQDMGGQFPGMPGIPPWQLDMWSTMAAGGGPPPLGTMDFGAQAGAGTDGSSWEALFEFLGPDSAAAAAMANGMQPTPVDFMGMSTPVGYGMPDPAQFVMPSGVAPASGLPPTNGAATAV